MTIHLTPEDRAQYLADFDVHCAPHREATRQAEQRRATGESWCADDTPWWIAISNTSCERRATQGLVDRGFEVWWPVRIATRSVPHTKLKVEREYPAFPGYLFTRHVHRLAWHEMLGVDGLKAIVMQGTGGELVRGDGSLWSAERSRGPVTVEASKIDGLKAQLAPLAQSAAIVSLPVGSPVVITEGPMAGVRGLLTAILGKGAVEVAVSMFGGQAPVRVARENVEFE